MRFGLPKPKYEFNLNTGIIKKTVKRKNFKLSTQKIEWNQAAGRADDDLKTTSKCRHYSKCGARFVWKKGGYQFDHWDNKSENNSQKNCHLVCATCHSRDTKIGKRKIKGLMGQTIGYKTIKHKKGYKKVKRAKKKAKSIKKKAQFYDPNAEYAKIQKRQEQLAKKLGIR